MTQTVDATRLKTGTPVRHRRDPSWVGEIRQPDTFYLTLRLRGVAPAEQKLVLWPDADLCTWERTADLLPEETS